MSKVDVQKMREALGYMAASDYGALGELYPEPPDFAREMGAALDELEALRKPACHVGTQEMRDELARIERECGSVIRDGIEPVAMLLLRACDELDVLRQPVAPCRFDVVAAREELARIDADWTSIDRATQCGAYHDARALLDRALDAIDAGWPAVDIEGAGEAAWCALYPELTAADMSPKAREDAVIQARAVLAHVGRVGPTITTDVPQSSPMGAASRLLSPVTITDAVVEEAAIRAWCAVDADGDTADLESWGDAGIWLQNTCRGKARAVLEYAASLGGVASVSAAQFLGAAREEMGKIDRQWATGWASAHAHAFKRDRALLESALKTIGGDAPPAGKYVSHSHVHAPAQTVRESRRYALPIGETRPVLCTAHGMTEEQVIHRLVGALDTVSADLQRCVEESHATPAVDPRAERLLAYRCAAISALMVTPLDLLQDQSAGGIRRTICDRAEEWAHSMLAAERTPS